MKTKKTNEEIIKHKNVLVKKYDFFIKNFEGQLSYFKNEYNSRHKKNIKKWPKDIERIQKHIMGKVHLNWQQIILGIIIKFFYLLELICMLLNLHVLEVI